MTAGLFIINDPARPRTLCVSSPRLLCAEATLETLEVPLDVLEILAEGIEVVEDVVVEDVEGTEDDEDTTDGDTDEEIEDDDCAAKTKEEEEGAGDGVALVEELVELVEELVESEEDEDDSDAIFAIFFACTASAAALACLAFAFELALSISWLKPELTNDKLCLSNDSGMSTTSFFSNPGTLYISTVAFMRF